MAWWLWLHAVVASYVLLSSLVDYSQAATPCDASNTFTKITDGEWALPEFRAISSIWKTSEQIWACYFSQANFLFPCSEPFSHPAENYLVNDVRGRQKVNVPFGFFVDSCFSCTLNLGCCVVTDWLITETCDFSECTSESFHSVEILGKFIELVDE